jgi:hypothetical protein
VLVEVQVPSNPGCYTPSSELSGIFINVRCSQTPTTAKLLHSINAATVLKPEKNGAESTTTMSPKYEYVVLHHVHFFHIEKER